VAYVTLSPDGRVVDGNLLAARILRLTQTQLLQRHFEDFIVPADLV
jgi:PAS domain-containing protein